MGDRHRRSRFSEEAGFALIEALVSAVVLIVIAVGTLGAIDRAQKTSGFGKNRSVAAALAEQDQARLRGLPANSLSTYASNHTASRAVSINGLNYTVASTVDWIRDATGGTLSCTNNSSQADYLKLTSTVSANSIQPVKVTSLSAPPLTYSSSRGTLVVQVVDGAAPAAGVSGVSVTISGPTSMSGTTNALGCAVFSFIPPGAYSVSIIKGGYVDYAGTTGPITGSKTVTGGSLTTLPVVYDNAGSIPVNFETDIGTSGVFLQRSRGYNAAANNTGVPAGFRSTASHANPPVPTVTLTNLFPFRTAYNAYAGKCAAANPQTYIPNANWFTGAGQIGVNDSVIVPPGGTSAAVTLRQPALDVKVTAAGTPITAAAPYSPNIKVTPQDTNCMPAGPLLWTIATNPTDGSGGWLSKDPYNFGGSTGTVNYDPGLPFGKYDICVDAVTGTGSNQKRRMGTLTVDLKNAAGAGGTIDLSTTSLLSSSCP
jgi:Tfp pilus assembly protein PilV